MPHSNLFARAALFMRVVFTASLPFMGATLTAAAPASAEDSRLSGFADAVSLPVTAQDIVIETESAIYAIKTIALRGTSMTNADLAALLDPKTQLSLADRFSKLSASEVFIPELTVTAKSTPVQKVAYQNVKFSDVQQGKAATADIEATHFSVADAREESIEGSYGTIHAQGLDLALASRVMTETREDESEPLKVLYDNFSMEGFRINVIGQEPISMTIGKVTGRDVKARTFAIHPSDLQSTAGDRVKFAALTQDLFTSIEMEDMVANDIELKSRSDGRPFYLSLAKMSMSKLGKAKIADIDFGSLFMKVQGSGVKVDDIDFKSVDFQKSRNLPVKAPSDKTESEMSGGDPESGDSSQLAALVPSVSQFIVNKAAISLDEDKRAVETTKPDFLVDHFELDDGLVTDTKPLQATVTLDHFTLDLQSVRDADLRPFIEMGYSKLDLSAKIAMAWNADTKELDIQDVSISGVDMGAVKVTGVIDNISKDFFSGDSTAMQAAALGALVKKVEIRIDNGGLFDKAMALQAKTQKQSIDTVKQSYVTAAAIGIPAMLDNRPASKIIGAALAKFVANPKTFHLIAIAADGLGAADFALVKEPAALLDALDIKATANE